MLNFHPLCNIPIINQLLLAVEDHFGPLSEAQLLQALDTSWNAASARVDSVHFKKCLGQAETPACEIP